MNGNAEMVFVVVGNKCDMEVEYIYFYLVAKFPMKRVHASPRIMGWYFWKFQPKLLTKLKKRSRRMQKICCRRSKKVLLILKNK